MDEDIAVGEDCSGATAAVAELRLFAFFSDDFMDFHYGCWFWSELKFGILGQAPVGLDPAAFRRKTSSAGIQRPSKAHVEGSGTGVAKKPTVPLGP